MKYSLLLRILRLLIYIKRFFWWLGTRISFVLANFFGIFARFIIFLQYKISYFLKKNNLISTKEGLWHRGFLQLIVFLSLFIFGLDQTTLISRRDLSYSTQKTLAYTLFGGDQDYILEEIASDPTVTKNTINNSWKIGVVDAHLRGGGLVTLNSVSELGAIVAGGTALSKPILAPGGLSGGGRSGVVEYIVEPGDSLSSIAYEYQVSIETIMWENGLTVRSILKLGDVLRIPPTSGIMYKVKKGDTIKKIATLYRAKTEDIIGFNHLKANGSDLVAGEQIMVPGGIKPVAPKPKTKAPITVATSNIDRRAAPPGSKASPSVSGFIWPSSSHTLTQYFGIRHHALDIAGPWQTPTYAAKAGVVEKAQCGWNGGYGCYVIINHGNGVKTLYAHHSQLLVSVGDEVETGQTIALMGNSGNVRGVTGIHLHFEVRVNGINVNPLSYVR